jgi:hypothetical protein
MIPAYSRTTLIILASSLQAHFNSTYYYAQQLAKHVALLNNSCEFGNFGVSLIFQLAVA